MKEYLVTILMREIVLVNQEVWKAASMQEVEERVNNFLTERQFKGKLGSRDVVRKTEELNGDKIKWLEIITRSGDNVGEIFFISMEEKQTSFGMTERIEIQA